MHHGCLGTSLLVLAIKSILQQALHEEGILVQGFLDLCVHACQVLVDQGDIGLELVDFLSQFQVLQLLHLELFDISFADKLFLELAFGRTLTVLSPLLFGLVQTCVVLLFGELLEAGLLAVFGGFEFKVGILGIEADQVHQVKGFFDLWARSNNFLGRIQLC